MLAVTLAAVFQKTIGEKIEKKVHKINKKASQRINFSNLKKRLTI